MAKGGEQQQQTTTQVAKAEPWAAQSPYLQDVFKQAQQQYYSGTPTYFPGQATAGQDTATLQGQQSALDTAGQIGGLADTTRGSAVFNMTAGRDVATNPYLQSAIQAAITPALRNFSDAGGALSQIRGGAMQAGQYGGSRQGIAEGLATSRLNTDILNTGATMANRGYETGLAESTKAMALTPSIAATMTQPAQIQSAVGQQRQDYSQQLINDAMQKWNFEQNAPAAKLAQYQNLVQGNYGGTSESTGTAPPPTQRSTTSSLLGGALAGASLGSAVPGIGTGVGAGLGAMLALLG